MENGKRDVKREASLRATLYDMVLNTLAQNGYTFEPVVGGSLITIDSHTHCKLTISVCNEDKVPEYLADYAEQQKKSAERAQARADKEAEKARKAQERAENKVNK